MEVGVLLAGVGVDFLPVELVINKMATIAIITTSAATAKMINFLLIPAEPLAALAAFSSGVLKETLRTAWFLRAASANGLSGKVESGTLAIPVGAVVLRNGLFGERLLLIGVSGTLCGGMKGFAGLRFGEKIGAA